MGGDLQYDLRSALIVTELIAGLSHRVDYVIAGIVVDLTHSEDPPSQNALSRAASMSIDKMKGVLNKAEPLPYPKD